MCYTSGAPQAYEGCGYRTGQQWYRNGEADEMHEISLAFK